MRPTVLIFFLYASTAWALKPIEGILLGEASEDLQQDPLQLIFSERFDNRFPVETQKLKLYREYYNQGTNLKESCSYFSPPKYSNDWREMQSRKTIASALQYIGLDLSIKAIGAYAKKISINENDYSKLSSNILKNYCSKNLTVFSLKLIEKNLKYYYDNPAEEVLPKVGESPFVSEKFKKLTSSDKFLSNQFENIISNFRAFCSWGGSPDDYRLMVPYLKNPFVMAFVINNLSGKKFYFESTQEKFVLKSNPEATIQVSCDNLICRRDNFESFKNKFPMSLGSTGIFEDLSKSYCHHFSKIDYQLNTIPEVKKWIKEQELEDDVFETSAFISLINGFPDAMFGIEKYSDLTFVSKSSFDEKWGRWSGQAIKSFSKDLLFEEPLKIKTVARRDPVSLKLDGFGLNFLITLGEMDRVVNTTDKIDAYFDLGISKNYLRSIRIKWTEATRNIDADAQNKIINDIKNYIGIQLKEKEKYFKQQVWNKEFERLVAEEILGQAMAYQGPMFKSYQDEIIKIPVNFSYGLFALNYIRYRADINAGRLKLKL